MTKNELLTSIVNDLGANYYSDDANILSAILDEIVDEALFISNRSKLVDEEDTETLNKQLTVLSANIRKCVKSIYLQRGSEDVKSQTLSGLNSTYENAIETLEADIVKSGKRILF